MIAGRGYGKTRVGAETTIEEVKEQRSAFRGHLIARTAGDVRDVVVEGESGILARSPPDFRPVYEPSKRRLSWPNGAVATTFSADQPDALRGPQCSWIWADELAAWTYRETWDQARFGLRLGAQPRALVTTTPRPTSLVREIVKDPGAYVTRGSTYDNAANLAPGFLAAMKRRYEGTTIGRQELRAEILDETPGALWRRADIDRRRVDAAPELARIVVAIDPATTSGEESDETGIVVVGLGRVRTIKSAVFAAAGPAGLGIVTTEIPIEPTHAYVLEDLSGRHTPDGWARIAIEAYRRHSADRIVAEVNQGGDLVEATLRHAPGGREAAYRAVRASRGKVARAEPVAALYERGVVHHVGALPGLEDQLVTWVPGQPSPDRLDALVWALTEIVLDGPDGTPISADSGSLDVESPWYL